METKEENITDEDEQRRILKAIGYSGEHIKDLVSMKVIMEFNEEVN